MTVNWQQHINKMGCSGSKTGPESLDRPRIQMGNKLVLLGDYFNAETRALIAILQLSETPFTLMEIDQLKEEHLKDQYLQVNPTGQVPTMLHGSFKIIGAANMFVGYLASCMPRVREKFVSQDMEAMMVWYQARLRPVSIRLTQAISKFKQSGSQVITRQPSIKGTDQSDDIIRDLNEFLKFHLPTLERRFETQSTKYLCGDRMCAVDILFFCEISQILVLTEKKEVLMNTNMNQTQYPLLASWFFKYMNSVPQVEAVDKRFREIVKKHNNFY
ncbi:hypothetical protein FGO68_gene14219 [Halteria grandinella]|uniref:GST N-terminal domain-containing protein n=1 Tax=Halteria grandinella TaxID=5974 RepID=A0A8J8SZI8_HALGN|nr:hypothetical protein FGO68_gene14219 [Halteria grandinella]